MKNILIRVKCRLKELVAETKARKRLKKVLAQPKNDVKKVVFMVHYIPSWIRHKLIYDALCASDKAEAFILCVPSDINEKDPAKNDIYHYFKERGYDVINAINEDGSSVTINANKVDISSVADDVTADVITGLTLSASNGESSSTIKLKYGSLVLKSVSISMTGMVTFSDLETDGYTTINGSNITTGTISADRIDTESLACTAVYAKDYPSGHYFALNGNWGDFGIFSPNADSTNNPMDESCVFGAYHEEFQTVNFYCFGYNFMGFNATYHETLFAKGQWDFTNAKFLGTLDFSTATNIIYPATTSLTAVFGG